MNYRLTLFDLNLVPSFKNQYFIAKALYRSFLHDYKLAVICPKIEYYPDDSKISKEEKEKCPKIYYRQGINSGLLDMVVDAMIIKQDNGSSEISRIKTYGEFLEEFYPESPYVDRRPQIKRPISDLSYLFLNFHFEERPVLLRILIAQWFIYKLIIETYRVDTHSDEFVKGKIRNILSEKNEDIINDLNWGNQEQGHTNSEELSNHFDAIKQYLENVILKEYELYWK